ncbi:MAG: hypothetical protein RL266_2016 [Bacteroidota bacterium]|jgi:hypothetical protein
MIKLKYSIFLLFFTLSTALIGCDEGGSVCDPATELTGTKWYKFTTSTEDRAVYEFNSCGSGKYSIQYLDGGSWYNVTGMPLEGSYESENGVCTFFAASSNYGFEYDYSGGVLVITNSYVNSNLEGAWTQL